MCVKETAHGNIMAVIQKASVYQISAPPCPKQLSVTGQTETF